MNQGFDPTEIYQPDDTLELFDELNDTEFASQDITAFPLAALFQEAEQAARDYTYRELNEALLVA